LAKRAIRSNISAKKLLITGFYLLSPFSGRDRRVVAVSRATWERLRELCEQTGAGSIDEIILQLLDTYGERSDPVTRAVVVQWLSTFISARKIPEVLAVTQQYHCGTVTEERMMRKTTVARIVTAMGILDDRALGDELKAARAVYAAFDTSQRGNLPRGPVFASFARGDGVVVRLLAAEALPCEAAEDEATAIIEALARHGALEKLVGIIGDNCAGIQAPRGTIGTLEERVGAPLVRIGCWLHVLNLALVHAIEDTFGKAPASTSFAGLRPNVINLLYTLWWATTERMSKNEFAASMRIFCADCNIPFKSEQCPQPIMTRWHTVVDANSWVLERRDELGGWCKAANKTVASNRRRLRESLDNLSQWLEAPVLLAQQLALEEFRAAFFEQELAWAEAADPALGLPAGFKASCMPAHVVRVLKSLADVAALVELYFPRTLAVDGVGAQELVEKFLASFIAALTPHAAKWLKLPLVAAGLCCEDELAREIAIGLLSAVAGKKGRWAAVRAHHRAGGEGILPALARHG